jgi:hypothetical protein
MLSLYFYRPGKFLDLGGRLPYFGYFTRHPDLINFLPIKEENLTCEISLGF